nr:DUF2892 domain-containing protein [uncultured Dokdonia sp.]
MNIMDRIARFVISLVLLGIVIFGPLWNLLGFFLILLSGLFLAAGISGFCPFYKSIDVDFSKSDEYFK